MVSDEKPKRRGRPPKTSTMRRMGNLTFRVRGDMREKLSACAEVGGYSISEEIERRLVASFEAETLEALLRRVIREER